MTSDTTAAQDEGRSRSGQDADAKAYIATHLKELRQERENLKARLDGLQDRERTLWADARRAGVSFGRIADVSGVDRATVFYALNPRGKASDTTAGQDG